MKVVIFGATGKTGRELVRAALDRGHEVTVFVRNPERLGGNTSGLRVLTGDFADREAVVGAVQASDTDWTIVRPSGLTEGSATGTFMAGERIRAKTSQISRADVANYMVDSLTKAERIHTAPTLTN